MTSRPKDVQRLFLQAVLSRGILSDKLAQTLWSKCREAVQEDGVELSDDTWEDFLVGVSDSLNPLDLEFRGVLDESNGRKMFAMVNRKDDAIAQLATDYTPGEIAFFKALIEQIILAPRHSFSISSMAALREVSTLKPKSNMTKTQAEIVLSSFVGKGWLLRSRRGRYSLATRALVELDLYLRAAYADEVLTCSRPSCGELVTKGVGCPAADCDAHFHGHCMGKRSSRRTCPKCGKDWPSDVESMVPVGEGAVRDGDDGKRRVRKSVEDSDEDDEDEEDDSEEDAAESSQPKRQGRGRVDDSMDVEEDEQETPKGKRRSRANQ